MSQQSWTVLVDGKQQLVTADNEWQSGRSVILEALDGDVPRLIREVEVRATPPADSATRRTPFG